MKVLYNALEKQDWKKQCKCMKCSSKLELVATDLTFVADSRDGNAYTFICPVCKHENWLAASHVPSELVP